MEIYLAGKTMKLFAVPLWSWLGSQPHSKLSFEEDLCLILGLVHLEDSEKGRKGLTRLQLSLCVCSR